MFNIWTIFVHAIHLLPPIVGWEQVCVLWTLLCKPETSPRRTRELWVSHTLVSPCSRLFLFLSSSILPFSFLPSSVSNNLFTPAPLSLLFPQHSPQENEWELSEAPAGTRNGGKSDSSVPPLCSHAEDHKAASANERDSEMGTKWPSKSWTHGVLSQSSTKGLHNTIYNCLHRTSGELGVQFHCLMYPFGICFVFRWLVCATKVLARLEIWCTWIAYGRGSTLINWSLIDQR